MKRLFRGYSIKHNKWVYGFYVKARGHHYILQEWNDTTGYDERWEAGEWIEVYEESVGQFSGYKDLDGTDIYEGDSYSEGNYVELSFGCFNINGDRQLTSVLPHIKIIGKKYEKPL